MASGPKSASGKTANDTRVLALKCKWNGCGTTLALPADGYQAFSEHVYEHLKGYLDEIMPNRNYEEATLLRPLKCMWFECQTEIRGSVDEFTRHVMFHAYHSKLKCLGAFIVIAEKLRQCSFDVETQDLLPDLSDPFTCRWESCGLEFCCPDQFYRHVDMHGHEAHREDVLVTTGEKMKPRNDGELKDELEGLTVQKMMQSVCRWEGCSYLAKDPWKIKEHCRTHTGERKIACPSCGMFFANKTKLADHLIRQDTRQYENFQCSHCLKRCASERLLRDHMRHHVNHVKCPHCDMTCPNPSALRSHLKFKHSLDRPFKCSMCDYSCKTKHDLQRHEEIHFEKRLECDVEGCSYESKTVSGLRAHVKAVHDRNGARHFMCHICEKTLSRGFLLTKHLKKAHHFSWPSGHSRFRYKLDEDGYYRLQMVRFESAELTEQLSGAENSRADSLYSGQGEQTPIHSEENSVENAAVDIAAEVMAVDANSVAFSSHQEGGVPEADASNPGTNSGVVALNLNEGYEVLLRYYEMTKENENVNSDLKSSNATCVAVAKAKEASGSELLQEKVDHKTKRKQLTVNSFKSKKRKTNDR